MDGDTRSLHVKFGTIQDTNNTDRKVEFTFEVLNDFGIITRDTVQSLANLLKIHRMQLYRTHWAVVQGDGDSILEELSKEFQTKEPLKKRGFSSKQAPDSAPPIGTANSVEEFLGHVFSASGSSEKEYFFRGHEDPSFLLAPSVMREWDNGAPMFLPEEERMGKELLISHYDEFHNDQYCFDRLVRMQHYGLPTRLLDLSGNPLIALFFACEKAMGNDGQVVIFGVDKNIIKYYDSDTVSCISNLSKLTEKEKREIDTSKGITEFNDSDIGRQLLHHVKSEKPYFDPRMIPEHIGSIQCVKAKRNNIRIKSQHGAFLLFGHGAKMPEEGTSSILAKRITIKNKTDILSQLDKININTSTVYPSIDQSADHIRASFQLSRE